MRSKILVFLLIILLIAAFFRLWKLNEVPPGLWPDAAIYAIDALESLRTGNLKVYYPDNFGREGLYVWLLALSFSIFGISIWSSRIVGAVIGILTVLGLYLLAKELFQTTIDKKERTFSFIDKASCIALFSSFFLAVSFWDTNFSRLGFRAILQPFIMVFAFYFLFKGFRTFLFEERGKILNLIISAIFFGFGFYTYISYRFTVILLPLVLLFWLLLFIKEKKTKKFFLASVCWLLVIILVSLPIALYFIQNPEDFIGRAIPISVFAAENPIKEFLKSLILHLGMFNFYGDPNWRHNFSGSPMLPWPLGILFLVGIFFSIKESIRSLKLKNWELGIGNWTLISWFFIMLLPGILTYEGIPHALRVIGVIPAVYIFVGLGGWYAYQWFSKIIKNKKILIILCLLFLVFVSWDQFYKYFFSWAKNPALERAFAKRYVDMGNYLNTLPEDVQKYVIVNKPGEPFYGISIAAQTPIFIESTKFGKARATYLPFENLDQIEINNKKTIIIPLYNGKILEQLQKKFPQGEILEKDNFNIYKILK